MSKIFGFGIAGIGLVSLLMSSPAGASIPIIKNLPSNVFLLAGLAFVIIGVLTVSSSSKEKQEKEVPIFKGKKIVGYRRH